MFKFYAVVLHAQNNKVISSVIAESTDIDWLTNYINSLAGWLKLRFVVCSIFGGGFWIDDCNNSTLSIHWEEVKND